MDSHWVLNSGDILHHVQQPFQFLFQLRHYSLQPYLKLQAHQLLQLEQNIQVLPVLIYTFMELRAGISQAAIEQWGIISNNKAVFPLVFNLFVSSALLLNRGPGTGTWYGDSSNTTLTGISCVTPDYVLNGTYIAIGA